MSDKPRAKDQGVAKARESVLARIRKLVRRMEATAAGDFAQGVVPDPHAAQQMRMRVTVECLRAQIRPDEVGLAEMLEDTAGLQAAAPERRVVLLSADQQDGIARMEAHFSASATCEDCGYCQDLPCTRHRTFVLAGPAGSGKSTLAGAILRRYGVEAEAEPAVPLTWRPSVVAMAAPTNVAALRLLAITGQCAGTYHSIAYVRPVVDTETGELLGFVARGADDEGGKIMGRALLILDEASMADEKIREDLLAALPRTVRLLVIGDPCQLPPVKGRPGFDLEHPDHMLTQIHRQEGESPLLDAITAVREGHLCLTPSTVVRLGGEVVQASYAVIGAALARHVLEPGSVGSLPVLIVRTNAARYRVNVATRAALSLPPLEQGPCTGERVIAFSTNHRLLIANSEQGTVIRRKDAHPVAGEPAWLVTVEWDGRGQEMVVVLQSSWHPYLGNPWDPQAIVGPVQLAGARSKPEDSYRLIALQPAYAVTVHKAQGLEYDMGGILLEPHRRGDDWRAAYTAISRFRRAVWFLQAIPEDAPAALGMATVATGAAPPPPRRLMPRN